MDDLSEDDQAVPDLDKVFAFQTNHQSFGDFIMPLVAHMPENNIVIIFGTFQLLTKPVILKIYSISFIAGAVFLSHSEFGDEARIP